MKENDTLGKILNFEDGDRLRKGYDLSMLEKKEIGLAQIESAIIETEENLLFLKKCENKLKNEPVALYEKLVINHAEGYEKPFRVIREIHNTQPYDREFLEGFATEQEAKDHISRTIK